jgi:hypothetical protein
LAQSEAGVAEGGCKAVAASRAPELAKRADEHRAACLTDISKLSERLGTRALGRQTRLDQLSFARFEMRGDLGVDIRGDSAATEEQTG